MKTIKIDQIRIDGGTQPRCAINEATVAEYAESLDSLPPVSLFFDGKDYWLADGFHRYHAHRKAGAKEIAATIHNGTARDAILFSVGANATHGLRRTNADKRQAVETLLHDAEWVKWPEAKIAESCKVSRTLVRDILEELHLVEKQDATRTVERGGKTYQQNVTNIGKSKNKKAKSKAEETPPEYADGDPDDNELTMLKEREALDRAAFDKLVASDDALATAYEEIKRLNAELAVVKGQRDQYMNRCNELIRQVRAMKRAA